jgi:hypothetical protein
LKKVVEEKKLKASEPMKEFVIQFESRRAINIKECRETKNKNG